MGEHRRGHGGLYAALARGGSTRIGCGGPWPRCRFRGLSTAGWSWPSMSTCWLRPDAHTSPERILCHTYGRGEDQHIPVPGRPYSIVCALEPGRSSWTAPLDAVRLAPGDELIERLITAGQWRAGEPAASAGTSATSTRRRAVRPVHRNPPTPDPAGQQGARTAGPPHDTTCTRSANPTPRNRKPRSRRPLAHAAQVKTTFLLVVLRPSRAGYCCGAVDVDC